MPLTCHLRFLDLLTKEPGAILGNNSGCGIWKKVRDSSYLVSSLMGHNHSPFYLFIFSVLTLVENNAKKKKKRIEKCFCVILWQMKHYAWLFWQKATGHPLFERNQHKQNTHKWHGLYTVILANPILCGCWFQKEPA